MGWVGLGGGLLQLVGDIGVVLLDDRQGVCLRVEHPVVEWQVVVFREEKVEVLERLCQVEALLDVIVAGSGGVDVFHPAVPPLHPAVLLQSLRVRGGWWGEGKKGW